MHPVRRSSVEHRLDRHVGDRADELRDRRPDLQERRDRRRSRGRIAGPHEQQHHDGLPVAVRGKQGHRGRQTGGDRDAELVGCLPREAIHEAQDLGRVGERPDDRAPEHDRPDRMEPVLERRRDPEVPSPSAEAPEQVGLGVPVHVHPVALRRHQVDGAQVVDGETELPHQVPQSTPERESGDPGVADDAARGGQPERVGRGVEVAPGRPALGAGRARQRVHPDTSPAREVDDDGVVSGAEARHAVGPPTRGHREAVLLGVSDGRHHIPGVGRAHDHGGATVDHRVVDPPRRVVLLVIWADHLTANALAQRLKGAGHGRLLRTSRVDAHKHGVRRAAHVGCIWGHRPGRHDQCWLAR